MKRILAAAAIATECAPAEPCWVLPSQNVRLRPMYSARSIGPTSEPRVIIPSMSSFRRPASAMARRAAWDSKELVDLPLIRLSVGSSPMPTIAA